MTGSRFVDVAVPGDKSITHRALILSTLADGESHLSGLLDAADTRSTAAALRALGSRIPGGALATMTVRGRGVGGWSRPEDRLDCGNSGTTARLLLGALAGCPLDATLTGDPSLRRRPMRRVTEPLSGSGARFEELGEPGRLPIRVEGAHPLNDVDHFSERSSAQVKTALLLAGLTGGARAVVTEPRRSRDHTERMLLAMGAALSVEPSQEGTRISVQATASLEPLDIRVPGDFSSAAFFLALGALRGAVRVRHVGLNPTRTGMLAVLRRMGAEVRVEESPAEGGEPVGNVTVRRRELVATTVVADEFPTLLDEIPILAALAVTAGGETRFEGVAELRLKESDRVQTMVDNLAALGVETDAGPDHLVVRASAQPLRGTVEARGDHRIAMAFGVLASLPQHQIRVRGRDAVAISYPTFWDELERVNTEMEAQ